MPKIAVFGGTGYLASIIKSQNNCNKNKFIFFSRKKNIENYIDYSSIKKKINSFKKFDIIIHLIGPNQSRLKKNKLLIQKKNKITTDICDLCLLNNIKLIYISSMQVYNDYGKKSIVKNSKINLKNPYAKSHYDTENIIKKRFLNHKNMFSILRMGNVFGFKKYENLTEINNNIINSLCISAIRRKKIYVKNGFIQRSFIPSKIFINVINQTINKKIFENSIINICYKNLTLEEIAKMIQLRFKLIFNLKIDLLIEKIRKKKKIKTSSNRYFKLNPKKTKIYFEIDQIFKNLTSVFK